MSGKTREQRGGRGVDISKPHRARDQLDSRGNYRMSKSFSQGFGVVRILTNSSQREVFDRLNRAGITDDWLHRKPPLHVTVIGFVGMNKREQTAFHAGFNVKRLEEKLEKGVDTVSPRTSLTVDLGSIATAGNVIYSQIDDPYLSEEQVQLAGQVALHGISPQRINRQVVVPHLTLGYAGRSPIEECREAVETALLGMPVALQRWDVYPDRYA